MFVCSFTRILALWIDGYPTYGKYGVHLSIWANVLVWFRFNLIWFDLLPFASSDWCPGPLISWLNNEYPFRSCMPFFLLWRFWSWWSWVEIIRKVYYLYEWSEDWVLTLTLVLFIAIPFYLIFLMTLIRSCTAAEIVLICFGEDYHRQTCFSFTSISSLLFV